MNDGPLIASVRTVPAVQLRTVAWVKLVLSHATPAGDGDPAIRHDAAFPSVNRLVAVAGSTTWSSRGPQQNGPPPCVHDATTARTRLFVPRQPTGHSVREPVWVNRLRWLPPPLRSST